jgi:hypothetical protein
MEILENVLNDIESLCQPVSTFLYGSRARTDFNEASDFEIGVLIPQEKYVRIHEIRKAIRHKGISVYPFRYEDFISGKIDTPFQKSIFLRSLILSGRTLRGHKVLENMIAPPIRVIDVVQDLRFHIGVAVYALLSHRHGDTHTATSGYYKSCLFGTRSLEILMLREFPVSYDVIFELSKKLNLEKYSSLVINSYDLRQGRTTLDDTNLFKNIAYLSEFVEQPLMKHYSNFGNDILIA